MQNNQTTMRLNEPSVKVGENKPPPFCINCKFIRQSENEHVFPHLCEHPMFSRNIDIVTGKPVYPPCNVLRSEDERSPCGLDGKLFEKRIELTIK